jgi:hypothetical protein
MLKTTQPQISSPNSSGKNSFDEKHKEGCVKNKSPSKNACFREKQLQFEKFAQRIHKQNEGKVSYSFK